MQEGAMGGKWKFRKPEPTNIRGPCVLCGKPQKRRGVDKYQALCKACDERRFGDDRTHYTRYKKNTCERCGFVPEHSCQLEVDHVDGNNKNNNPSNLKTLCSNCHRLKTWLERR